MVCKTCEAKLNKVATTDPYRNRNLQNTVVASGSKARAAGGAGGPSPSASRSGAGSGLGSLSVATGGPSREVGKNKLLSAKGRYNPMGTQCTLCKANVQQERAKYCQACAFKKGMCSMCGKPIMDANVKKMSKMSS